MSAEPAIPNTEEPAQLTVLETSDLAALTSKKPRPHDKIARLPKVLRDQVNAMLDDGIPYNLIVTRLQQSTDPPLPYPISEMNISRWKDGGYQRHLARQERFAYVTENREAALEMAAADTTTLPEGALQIIASHYYDILSDFSPASVKQKLAEDPLKYTRFLNVFARLTREIVNLKKHRDQGAKTASAELKPLDKSRPWNDIEREGFLDRADDLFNLKSAARLKREAATGSAGILAGLAVSPVEDQNSKIENVDETSPSPPLEERAGLSSEVVLTKEEERRPAEILPGIENPNSKILKGLAKSFRDAKTRTHKSEMQTARGPRIPKTRMERKRARELWRPQNPFRQRSEMPLCRRVKLKCKIQRRRISIFQSKILRRFSPLILLAAPKQRRGVWMRGLACPPKCF